MTQGAHALFFRSLPSPAAPSRLPLSCPLPSPPAPTSLPTDYSALRPPQVSVALSSCSIRVAVLEERGEHVLMEGKFTHKVNTESSLWSLEPGKCVLVSGVCAPTSAPSGGVEAGGPCA